MVWVNLEIASKGRAIKLLLTIFLLLGSLTGTLAQESDPVDYREIPQETIEDLLQNEDLDYPLEVGEKAGWFQTLFELIVKGLNWFYDLLGRGGLSNEFLYFISFLAAGVLIWLLLRSRYSWVFAGKSKDSKMGYEVHHEDIHSIDFESQIEHALKEEDFRLAVRLVYLRTLKLMSDYQLIYWAEGKTNNQYTKELEDQVLRREFSKLSLQFNYLWYGHFEAQNHHWEDAEKVYQQINNSIKKQ